MKNPSTSKAGPCGRALACMLGLVATPVLAQTHHQHYERASIDKPGPSGQLAPHLQNLGKYAFPVSTRSSQAQLFINQGLDLAYGFNHAEAGRAFREAARLDPDCMMAYWGQALVLGPNINAAMAPEDESKAFEQAQKALGLRGKASPRERAFIEALAVRYSGKAEDRAAGDRAYAAAMREVARRYPEDLDAAVLFAEALMDLRPWNYWAPDGSPYGETPEIVATLESVLARSPNHPGANHFYIHIMEPTKNPERAEAAADRLLTLMPGAGHMLHMPSHIYQRVGRYADAASANELAVAADEDYIAQCRAQGIYPIGYYPHNIHFLWFAATAEGRSKVALEAARKVAATVPDPALEQVPLLAGFRVVPYFALTRFGRWDEMLREPAPPKNLYLQGVWHYARGLAFVGKGELESAQKELAEVQRIASEPGLDFALFSPNSAASVFAIAPEVLGGTLAAARKEYTEAIAHLERAVHLEDSLTYTEPFEWHYPPRQALGAALIEAGRAREAAAVYWEDLGRNRENGWSLFGLAKALHTQGRESEASIVEARFRKAWARADVELMASRF